jgi:sarcosine oxidase, subunit gamma
MPEPAPMRTAPIPIAAVHINPVTGRTMLRLRSWLPEYAKGSQPVVLAGRELPSRVGAMLPGPMRVLCVAPGEWLIVSREPNGSSLHKDIEPDLPKYGLAIVDLTDGTATLVVRGSAAREVLSKGCGLDLDPRTFPPGRCARTRFAQIPVVIECLEDPARFELHMARSYLHYLHSWLTDAAAEYEALDVNS